MRMFVAAMCIAMFMNQSAFSQEADTNSTKLAEVSAFIQDNLIGKRFFIETTVKIDEGKVETDFVRNVSYSNFFQNDSVIRFDELISIQQTNFDIVAGKRQMPGKIQDRVLVLRHEYWQLKSTGAIQGLGRNTANVLSSSSDPTQNRITLDGDKLTIKSSTIGYFDMFEAGGGYFPGAVEVDQVFEKVDSKWKRTDSTKVFRVDIKTGKRTRTESPVEILENHEK